MHSSPYRTFWCLFSPKILFGEMCVDGMRCCCWGPWLRRCGRLPVKWKMSCWYVTAKQVFIAFYLTCCLLLTADWSFLLVCVFLFAYLYFPASGHTGRGHRCRSSLFTPPVIGLICFGAWGIAPTGRPFFNECCLLTLSRFSQAN